MDEKIKCSEPNCIGYNRFYKMINGEHDICHVHALKEIAEKAVREYTLLIKDIMREAEGSKNAHTS